MAAVTAYCTADDLASVGVNAHFLRNFPKDRIDAAIAMSSRRIDGYLKAHFKLPLTRVGSDIARCCAILTAYDVVSGEGDNPADPGYENLKSRVEMELAWLKQVALGTVTPDADDSSSTGPMGLPEPKARIVSNTQRGWFQADGKGGPFSGGR